MADPNVTVSYLTQALNAFMARTVQPAIDAATGAASTLQAQIDALRGVKVSGSHTLSTYGGPRSHNFGPTTYTVPDANAPDGTVWIVYNNSSPVALTFAAQSGNATLLYRGQAGASSVVVPSTAKTIVLLKVGANVVISAEYVQPYYPYNFAGVAAAGPIVVAGVAPGQRIIEAVKYVYSTGAVTLYDARGDLEPIITVAGQVQQSANTDQTLNRYLVRVSG